MGGEVSATRSIEARAAGIAMRLSELSAAFAANVRSATLDFTQAAREAELAGMPPRDLRRARRRAEARGQEGFLLTLDGPSCRAAIQSLEDRPLRKTLYEAYTTRASDRGPRSGRFDNTPILSEMLELRHELSVLHGLSNFAELALRDGVIPVPDEAERFLLGYHRETKARAQQELDRLWAFAKEKGVPRGFSSWDLAYYAAWWSREELGLDEEDVRAHFGLEAAVEGVLRLATFLLGLQFVPFEATDDAERFSYRVSDALLGNVLGDLDLDVFGPDDVLAEPGVRLFPGSSDELPISRVQCGFEPPEQGEPALLGHAEVEALFFGVGRGLYLLTTRAKPAPDAGARAYELGSIVAGCFFERFASHEGTLKTFARHRESGALLSSQLFDQLARGKRAHAWLRASQDLEFSLFDLRIHRDHVPTAKSTQLRVQVLDTFTQVRREQSALPPSYWTRFANTMTSIFVGGLASKLWELDWARERANELFAAQEASGFSSRVRDTFFADETLNQGAASGRNR